MGVGEIDSLEIQVKATAQKANQSLDTLIGKLDSLTTSLGRVNGNNLSSLSNGVQRLANSMQSMKSVGTADFTRLVKNISKMGEIDAAGVGKAASSLHRFSNALSKLDTVKVSDNAAQIGQLANGIKQLGYKSSAQAIENIPKLATAMRQLMTELSKAPKVSQNLIQMTEALAKLSRTGASSGRAATSLGKALNGYTASAHRASKGSFSLSAAIGKVYATYWLLFRAMSKVRDAINISSNLTEIQNVVDVTFGNMSRKVEEFAKTSIEQFGMSELSLKKYASRFQAMGSAMGISGSSIGSANSFLNKQTNGYVGLSKSMSDVSLNLTKLTADMASFYNVEQSAVAEDLASIFTGQTRPLRTYGLDLSQATLKEWALKNGLDADIKSMSQAEKTMLRYQYVMANTGAAQGDFARTANTWANQVRILKQNFEQLGAVVGGTLINAFKPLVQALNSVMGKLISFAETVSNALGEIFGWKYESGSAGITNDLEDAEDSADGIAGGIGDAADNAKKLKNNLLAIDELNVLNPDEGKSSGSGSGSGGGASGGSSGSGGQWVKQDSIFDDYKSSIDSLKGLGNYIRDALIGEMESINWDSIYKKAGNFGKGLAKFLNGLFEKDKDGNTVFGSLGTTIAGALNSIIYAVFSFSEEFHWDDFGSAIKQGIQNFINGTDLATAGYTVGNLVKGISTAVYTAVSDAKTWKSLGSKIAQGINGFLKSMSEVDPKTGKNGWQITAASFNSLVDAVKTAIGDAISGITWKDIISGIGDFLGELELDTIAVAIGAMWLKYNGKKIGSAWFAGQVATKLGISSGSLLLYTGLTISVGAITYEFANNVRGWVDSFKKWWKETSIAEKHIGYDEEGNEIEIHTSIGVYIDSIKNQMSYKAKNAWSKYVLGEEESINKNPGQTESASRYPKEHSEYVKKLLDLEENKGTMPTSEYERQKEEIQKEIQRINREVSKATLEDKSKSETDWSEIGRNIVKGITYGIQLESLATNPGTLIFDAFVNSICEVFGIHSPAENMKPYGKNILLGLVNGFTDSESEFATAISNWWKNSVKPWFTRKKWQELGENAKSSIIGKFDSMVTDWQTKISNWWKNDVSAWFQEKDWNTLADVINGNITLSDAASQWATDISAWWRDNVSAWFKEEDWQVFADLINGKISLSDAVTQWQTDISTWWKDDVEKWFTKKKWNDAMSGVVDAFEETWGTAISSIKQIWNNFAEWLNEKLTWTIDPVVIAGKTIFEGTTINLGKIPTFQVGGFPEDGLFMANHTELVGQFSNGKTAVANNEMIVAGIEEAAYRGFARAYAENSREADLLQELIYAVREGKEITIDGRSLVKAYDTRKARNGFSFT